MSAKILVVEDNPSNQKVLRWFLESMGHSCDVVATGAACLQAVAKHPYSLIFMDLNIPNMDGCAVAKFMREAGYTMPIIAVTAEDMPKGLDKCLEAGMNGYLSKPFTKAEFEDVLKRWLPTTTNTSGDE
jgi:CheY-like chemotaxis protein